MFTHTKNLCDFFIKTGIPGFDLIVYKDGKCVLRYMGGYADPESKTPMTGKEKYHIYSCSKLFTCVAAMQLWEKGLFRLEDKLSDYIPAFKDMSVQTKTGIQKAKNPILIQHLFSMTSGMTYDLQTPALKEYYEACNYTCPTLELVQEFAKTPLAFEPGEGWLYGLSHDVLAALVEILSGEKFEVYVKKNIFEPLGITHSDFVHPIEDWNGFARQFRYDETSETCEPYDENPYRPCKGYASGGAGCVSTVEDYIKFLEALRVGDVILKKETIAMMAIDRLTPKQRAMRVAGTEHTGYGLGMRTPREGYPNTEFGWGGAAGAFASVDPVNNITIFYAQHVLQSPNRAHRPWLYDAVLADLYGRPFEIPSFPVPLDPKVTY